MGNVPGRFLDNPGQRIARAALEKPLAEKGDTGSARAPNALGLIRRRGEYRGPAARRQISAPAQQSIYLKLTVPAKRSSRSASCATPRNTHSNAPQGDVRDPAHRFPAKSVAHADLAENEHPGPQYLQIRSVSPDGTERSYDEFTQARRDLAKVVDEQPINDRRLVTPQRLPPPVHDAEQETPTLPAQAPRQDELILARPEGKMPSWRARNAAGIFR
jgi:hypothetical protein